ncbi:MAG: hypothetical protein Q8K32_07025 [Archangium sp.]|nr:hypothetical protein [Archangium sp.]
MANETNKHVDRLRQYIPFQPGAQQLYEEYVADPDSAPKVQTKVFTFVDKLLADRSTRLVVLTGDAGHGKTHTCRRLLESMGADPQQTLQWLREKGDGQEAFESDEGRSVRIVKDLSDFATAAGIDVLLSCEDPSRQPLVVCANEGKIRDVVSGAGGRLDFLRETLEESTRSGVTSTRPGFHVINLNYQSVSAVDSEIIAELLKTWVQNGRHWTVCKRCDAAQACPIWANRQELTGSGESDARARDRREAIRLLLQVIEESGQVVTFRELLILIAYMITGGLSCKDVALRSKKNDWQHEYGYAQLTFAPPLTEDQKKSFPVFDALSRLDPGKKANRLIDEPLAVDVADTGGQFTPPMPDGADPNGQRTRRAAIEDAKRMRTLMEFRRRRDFFELATNRIEAAQPVRWAGRLGLRFYDDFEFLRSRRDDRMKTIQVRDRLITGLHAVQGMHVASGGAASLHLVDPAFARTEGAATIVARTIRPTEITIEPESIAWQSRNASPALPNAVDWLDRRVVIRFGRDNKVELGLDLLQFEYVMRAGEGLACRTFFRADIRRIMAMLALLIGRDSNGTDEISVLRGGKVHKLVVDAGLIRSQEG